MVIHHQSMLWSEYVYSEYSGWQRYSIHFHFHPKASLLKDFKCWDVMLDWRIVLHNNELNNITQTNFKQGQRNCNLEPHFTVSRSYKTIWDDLLLLFRVPDPEAIYINFNTWGLYSLVVRNRLDSLFPEQIMSQLVCSVSENRSRPPQRHFLSFSLRSVCTTERGMSTKICFY